MAEAKIAGQHFVPTHMVRRKNADGQRVEIEAPKRVREGWFSDASGKMFFGIRYAGKPIELAKDKNAIEVGELNALPGVLEDRHGRPRQLGAAGADQRLPLPGRAEAR